LPWYALAHARAQFDAQEQEAQMFTKTAAALAAALVIGMTAPSMAGEGSSDITDRWNHDRGGAPYAYGWSGWREPGYVYGSPGYYGYAYGSPGYVYGGPRVVIETDVNTGYVPRGYYGYDWD
jgi:hypothetical protein